jgi:hypothetical protein
MSSSAKHINNGDWSETDVLVQGETKAAIKSGVNCWKLGTIKEIDKWWAEDMENNACEWMAFLLIEIYFLLFFQKLDF